MNRLQLHHVLCPIDLSSPSMNSLEWANAIARARNAELRAFHVVITEGLVAPDNLGSLEHGDMMKKLQSALVTIDSENVHTGAAVRQGDPGTQILEFARSLPADVVVMGAAGTRTTDASDGLRNCGSRRPLRLSRSNRAHWTANRSVTSGRVQTDSVCGRVGAVFRRRHQASALARMGDTWTRDVRVRDDRTKSVSVRDSDPVIGGDPS